MNVSPDVVPITNVLISRIVSNLAIGTTNAKRSVVLSASAPLLTCALVVKQKVICAIRITNVKDASVSNKKESKVIVLRIKLMREFKNY